MIHQLSGKIQRLSRVLCEINEMVHSSEMPLSIIFWYKVFFFSTGKVLIQIDNRDRIIRIYFGILKTIETTETLHCLSLNLQTVKSKLWQHQELELEDINIHFKYCAFFSLSIIANTKHYLCLIQALKKRTLMI